MSTPILKPTCCARVQSYYSFYNCLKNAKFERDAQATAQAERAEIERRAACYDGLLEALQALLHSEWQDDDDATRLKEARELSRKAIAKALGEQA